MNYTAPEVLLIIAAVGAVAVNVISAWRMGTKIDAVKLDTAVVLGHVNSKETKYMEQLASKDRELELLKGIIVDKDKDKALLAQSTAAALQVVQPKLSASAEAPLPVEIVQPSPLPVKIEKK